jgi:hypothetical protein
MSTPQRVVIRERLRRLRGDAAWLVGVVHRIASAAGQLTPQELQVALVVAEGAPK